LHEVAGPAPALVSADGKISYPIRNGIPVLLESEATEITEATEIA
jgi:uncharacterized protein YbaR (Trm112 family)